MIFFAHICFKIRKNVEIVIKLEKIKGGVMMTKRELEILKYFIKYNGKISYKLLSEFLCINERSIRYDIDKINEILKSNNYPQIEKVEKGQVEYKNLDILPVVIDKFIRCIDLTEYKDEIILFKVLFLERINLKNFLFFFYLFLHNIFQ